MLKTKHNRLFALDIHKETVFAFILGLAAIVAGILVRFSDSILMWSIIRDVLQISIIGIVLPFTIMAKNKSNFFSSGIRFDRPLKYLLISLILGGLLAINFITKASGEMSTLFSNEKLILMLYIMIVNIFEVLFFAAFLRYYFEKALGIIPSVILSAAFYSLHHAGFQPEFVELFIIGIVFISIFRIANHWLICFPMWWVGGVGDVLISSADSVNVSNTAWWRGIIILIVICTMFYLKYPFGKKEIEHPSMKT
ncbi:MAG: hypothetical protein N3I35_16475 [Clostridia bacterium]|nr:hypothetical protein [Clostridia bacterium]